MVCTEHEITVLVTRPLNQGQEMVAALIQQGFKPLLNPLLEIQPLDCPPLPLKEAQAFIATSLNGVMRLSQLTPYRHLPLYVPGESSARQAHHAGFEHVYTAQGSVESLLDLLRKSLDKNGKPLFYISGQEIRGDLAQVLAEEGYSITRVVAYQALAVQALKPEIQETLIMGRLQAVLFFSPRTAEIFVTLTKIYKKVFESMIAVCLSEEISRPLKPYPWRHLLIAPEKSGRSMVETLLKYYKPHKEEE